ncbi:hypothetical protein [Lysinibacillus sp. G4S2]|nr:hypothetical protein [Lysinibacillus sp. G4S2]MDM5247639.1 hypothetical protein [Lysinibacillus sp. G4S2]
MDEFEKVLALVATAFKAFTSGFKDIHEMTQGKKKKRRSPRKKNRR